jgi:hypothetical protein
MANITKIKGVMELIGGTECLSPRPLFAKIVSNW